MESLAGALEAWETMETGEVSMAFKQWPTRALGFWVNVFSCLLSVRLLLQPTRTL